MTWLAKAGIICGVLPTCTLITAEYNDVGGMFVLVFCVGLQPMCCLAKVKVAYIVVAWNSWGGLSFENYTLSASVMQSRACTQVVCLILLCVCWAWVLLQ